MAHSPTRITLEEALSEVELRFLLNLPADELSKIDRLLFWIQEAHWFYDDFYCDNYDYLPRYNFKAFTKEIFNHCPLFSGMKNNVTEILNYYRSYKSKIPVCGAIILTPDMSKILLVCNWNGNSWTFPRGKLNESEESIDCAIREVYEETGFDITPYVDRDDLYALDSDEGNIKLFIVPNVASDTMFKPQTRKEISQVKFFSLNAVPDDSFAVKQFIKPLKNWISKQKKRRHSFDASQLKTTKKTLKTTTKSKEKNDKNSYNLDTFHGDSSKKWSVNDMFAANSSITGRNYDDYDGNPHEFGSYHPRYVNYNSDNGSTLFVRRDRDNTMSSVGDDLDLDLLAIKSNEFHILRTGKAIEELEISDIKATTATIKATKKDVTVSNTPSDSKKIKVDKSMSSKSKSIPEESKRSPRNCSFLLPVPFRANRDLIMAAFDRALVK